MLTRFKNLLLNNQWANFNQTWKKTLVKEIQFFFQIKVYPFVQGEIKQNSNNTLTTLKNLFLQNQAAYFNQTWHKASLGEGNSKFYK